MIERALLRYLQLPEWSRWVLFVPAHLVVSGLILLLITFLELTIRGGRGGPPPDWWMAFLVMPWLWAVSAALNSVATCILLPRGALVALYIGAGLSLIALAFAAFNSWELLFGTLDPHVTHEEILRESGMSAGNLWVFIRYRHEIVAGVRDLHRRSEANRVVEPAFHAAAQQGAAADRQGPCFDRPQ